MSDLFIHLANDQVLVTLVYGTQPCPRIRNDHVDQAKPIHWLITHQSDSLSQNFKLRDLETLVDDGEYVGSLRPYSLEMGAVWEYCKQRREKQGKTAVMRVITQILKSEREAQILALFTYKALALLFLCSIVNFKIFIFYYPFILTSWSGVMCLKTKAID